MIDTYGMVEGSLEPKDNGNYVLLDDVKDNNKGLIEVLKTANLLVEGSIDLKLIDCIETDLNKIYGEIL